MNAIYNHNDSVFVIYDRNDSGQYYKTRVIYNEIGQNQSFILWNFDRCCEISLGSKGSANFG
jgi:hypothetical protein